MHTHNGELYGDKSKSNKIVIVIVVFTIVIVYRLH